jgi:hypothetical protein
VFAGATAHPTFSRFCIRHINYPKNPFIRAVHSNETKGVVNGDVLKSRGTFRRRPDRLFCIRNLLDSLSNGVA